VIASQSLVNLSYNPQALTMLKEGIAPQRIIAALTAGDANAKRRQVAVINNQGEAAAFSGEGCIPEFGHYIGENYSVQANMMTKKTVIVAMKTAFESATGDLAARMVAALEAAQAEDGDIRGMQSAALLVVPGTREARDWESIYNLRVDEHPNPVAELERMVHIRHAQLIDSEGHQLLAEGKIDAALSQWERARVMVPAQEELAFWQAVTLADTNPFDDAVKVAASIFNSSLGGHKRRAHWLDLINRLVACGLIEREGAGVELLRAIERGLH
jgi:uncharacterized Ntn-hydrolase superfamily protein